MLSFRQWLRRNNRDVARPSPRSMDVVYVVGDDERSIEILQEGKWVRGAFDRNIRIDRATHLLSGEKHGHVYGRSRNDLVGVVGPDGRPSHGSTPFKLKDADADALRAQGIPVRSDNIVEGIVFETAPTVLLLEG